MKKGKREMDGKDEGKGERRAYVEASSVTAYCGSRNTVFKIAINSSTVAESSTLAATNVAIYKFD